MAPPKPKEETEEYLEEREKFLATLQEYHNKRGYVQIIFAALAVC